jgi:bifunctional DNase/RNase
VFYVILRRVLFRVFGRLSAANPIRLLVGLLVVILIGAGGLAAYLNFGPGRGSAGVAQASEVSVEGLEPNPSTGQILVILKEKGGNRRLAMVVADTEARTIFVEMQGIRSERPLTYDLMREIISRLGGRLSHVIVNHVSETTFYAKVVLDSESRQLEVDSRPSDAIALALRAKAPIYVDSQVLTKAGIASPN